MKKLKLVFAVLFMLISPIFGFRHFLLLKQSKDLDQLANEENIRNLENWAVTNGYAAAISLTIGLLLVIWIIKERRCNYNIK